MNENNSKSIEYDWKKYTDWITDEMKERILKKCNNEVTEYWDNKIRKIAFILDNDDGYEYIPKEKFIKMIDGIINETFNFGEYDDMDDYLEEINTEYRKKLTDKIISEVYIVIRYYNYRKEMSIHIEKVFDNRNDALKYAKELCTEYAEEEDEKVIFSKTDSGFSEEWLWFTDEQLVGRYSIGNGYGTKVYAVITNNEKSERRRRR